MKVGEIVFLIIFSAFVGFIIFGGITCAIINEVRSKRYEKFYKTTELGQDLLALLKTIAFTEGDIETYNEILKQPQHKSTKSNLTTRLKRIMLRR